MDDKNRDTKIDPAAVPNSERTLKAIAEKREIGQYSRHIFICAGPKCCQEEVGIASWQHLKDRCQELKERGITVYRSKVGCLRICQAGPTGLVYPEGTWYKDLSIANLDEVIESHLVEGKPVDRLIFAKNPL
jgi:(2Fe-2S) ferredoxin